MKESDYQRTLKKKLQSLLPGCVVLKNDSSWLQGVPDLTVLYKNRWAALEVKKSGSEPHQPNQDVYVDQMNELSFASFIFPENEKEVLDELQRALEH